MINDFGQLVWIVISDTAVWLLSAVTFAGAFWYRVHIEPSDKERKAAERIERRRAKKRRRKRFAIQRQIEAIENSSMAYEERRERIRTLENEMEQVGGGDD